MSKVVSHFDNQLGFFCVSCAASKISKEVILTLIDYPLSFYCKHYVTNKNNENENDFASAAFLLEIKLRITVTNSHTAEKYQGTDQILAALRNIEKDVSEYYDSGSESDAK